MGGISSAERIAIYAGTGRTRIDRALKFGGVATGVTPDSE